VCLDGFCVSAVSAVTSCHVAAPSIACGLETRDPATPPSCRLAGSSLKLFLSPDGLRTPCAELLVVTSAGFNTVGAALALALAQPIKTTEKGEIEK
jgi:hypothetical protein